MFNLRSWYVFILVPVIGVVILSQNYGFGNLSLDLGQLSHLFSFAFLCEHSPSVSKFLSVNCENRGSSGSTDEAETKNIDPIVDDLKREINTDDKDFKDEIAKSISMRQEPYSDEATYKMCMLTSEEEQTEKRKGLYEHGFNNFISEKIGVFRDIPDARNNVCKEKKYSDNLPSASIVMCFYNEGWAALLRSVNSIVQRTPPQLLKEIVLLDDSSSHDHLKEPLQEYISAHYTKVKLIRSKERLGLIRARMVAAREATGDVLVFLDSHIEAGFNWLEPLLERIARDRKTVVVPIVDTVDAETMIYREANLVRGGFTWSLIHNWEDLPQDVEEKVERTAEPFISPTMPGGLFAMERKYFYELGEYDAGMEIWGGENMEISFRIWMCGGRLEIVPCSRVGHVFRKFRPYKSPTGQDTATRNAARVAEVWLDEFKKHFYDLRPAAITMDIGDVSDRIELRKILKCKSFKWFLETIHPEQLVPGEKAKVSGAFRRPKEKSKEVVISQGHLHHTPSGLCVSSVSRPTAKGDNLMLVECKDLSRKTGNFELTDDFQVKLSDSRFCLDTHDGKRKGQSDITLEKCHGSGGSQVWIQQKFGGKEVLFNPASGKCLAASPASAEKYLFLDFCNSDLATGLAIHISH